MATTREEPAARAAGYQLEGTLLEVCSCDVLCPCWIGEDPDGGTCDSVVAYNLDKGTIRGVDVSGLTLVSAVNIPGNILEGNWRQLMLIDDRATEEQADAMLDAFSGKLGGPLADLARLVGEVVAVERAPISHEIVDGAGTLSVGDKIECAILYTRTRDLTAAPRRSTTRSSQRCPAPPRTSRWRTARGSTSPSTVINGRTRRRTRSSPTGSSTSRASNRCRVAFAGHRGHRGRLGRRASGPGGRRGDAAALPRPDRGRAGAPRQASRCSSSPGRS